MKHDPSDRPRGVAVDALDNEQFMSQFLSEQLDLRAGQRAFGAKTLIIA
jgi:hypothetical protein